MGSKYRDKRKPSTLVSRPHRDVVCGAKENQRTRALQDTLQFEYFTKLRDLSPPGFEYGSGPGPGRIRPEDKMDPNKPGQGSTRPDPVLSPRSEGRQVQSPTSRVFPTPTSSVAPWTLRGSGVPGTVADDREI